MCSKATLSSDFRITIPKEVRDAHAWQPGRSFVFVSKGSGVLMIPVPKLADLAGIARGTRKSAHRDRQDRY